MATGYVDATSIQAVLGRLVKHWVEKKPSIIVGLERCSRENDNVLLLQGEDKLKVLARMETAIKKEELDIEYQMLLLEKKGMLPKKGGRVAKNRQNLYKP